MSTVETKVGHFVWHENQGTDVEAAKSFYAKLLGWEYEVFKPGDMDYTMITSGGAMHGGFWPAPPEGAPSAWIGHVYVEDCDAAAEKAKAAGITQVTSGEGGVALLKEHKGRPGVVRTHPVSRDKPAELSGKFAIPAGKKSKLVVDVSHDNRGDWRLVAAFAVGALVCGFFWEMWNYWAYPKWHYSIPFVQIIHIFEMPLLGYTGYLPFGLEVYAAYHFLAGVAGWVRGRLGETRRVFSL